MSVLYFSEDIRETLKSFELYNDPSSWKIENFENSLVLTMVWHKTKQADSVSAPVLSSCDSRPLTADEGRKFENEDERQKISTSESKEKIKPRCHKQIRKRINNFEVNGDKSVETLISINNEEDDKINCKLDGSKTVTPTICGQNFGSSKKNSSQACALRTQGKDFQNTPRSRCCYGNMVGDKTARCSCGEVFVVKENAIRHLMFNCPVSLCFRTELDIKVNSIIDRWKSEGRRISGRKWWQLYKTSGSPNANMSFPEHALDDIEDVIKKFIDNSCRKKLLDNKGTQFVLIEGLEDLPTEEHRFDKQNI